MSERACVRACARACVCACAVCFQIMMASTYAFNHKHFACKVRL